MKTIEDVVMEHVEAVKRGSSTREAIQFLELPEKWEFNTAGNIYLSALHIIEKLMAKIEKLEKA
jgi:hypothetical protein